MTQTWSKLRGIGLLVFAAILIMPATELFAPINPVVDFVVQAQLSIFGTQSPTMTSFAIFVISLVLFFVVLIALTGGRARRIIADVSALTGAQIAVVLSLLGIGIMALSMMMESPDRAFPGDTLTPVAIAAETPVTRLRIEGRTVPAHRMAWRMPFVPSLRGVNQVRFGVFTPITLADMPEGEALSVFLREETYSQPIPPVNEPSRVNPIGYLSREKVPFAIRAKYAEADIQIAPVTYIMRTRPKTQRISLLAHGFACIFIGLLLGIGKWYFDMRNSAPKQD